MNAMTTTVSMLLANPRVAETIARYPEECGPEVRVLEYWQGGKWLKHPDLQTPSFSYGDGRTLYLGDFVAVRWSNEGIHRPAKIVRFYYRHTTPVRSCSAWLEQRRRRPSSDAGRGRGASGRGRGVLLAQDTLESLSVELRVGHFTGVRTVFFDLAAPVVTLPLDSVTRPLRVVAHASEAGPDDFVLERRQPWHAAELTDEVRTAAARGRAGAASARLLTSVGGRAALGGRDEPRRAAAQELARLMWRTPYAAAGMPTVLITIVPFCDDMKAGQTKLVRKLNAWDFVIGNLPSAAQTHLFNIHSICCSHTASPAGMQHCIAEEIRVRLARRPPATPPRVHAAGDVPTRLATLLRAVAAPVAGRQELENGVKMYDAHLKCDVLVVGRLLSVIADNARQSELVNHRGAKAKNYCRLCFVRRRACARAQRFIRRAAADARWCRLAAVSSWFIGRTGDEGDAHRGGPLPREGQDPRDIAGAQGRGSGQADSEGAGGDDASHRAEGHT